MYYRWVENPNLQSGLPVPYPRGLGPGGFVFDYIDLRKQPERAAEIPELRGYPELLDAIVAINQPSSIFRTLRCDARPDSIRREGYAHTQSSYVTIAFELLNWNVEENYRRLYREFGQTPLRPQPGDATVMNFIPVPVDFVEHDRGGTALDIYVIGAGQSVAEAREAWESGITALTNFLADISAKYPDQIKSSGPRIS